MKIENERVSISRLFRANPPDDGDPFFAVKFFA